MKKILLYIIFSLFIAITPVFSADNNNYYELGRQAYSSGDYKLAQRYFWALLNQNSSNLPARYYFANTFAKQQKYDDAYVEYQRIIQIAPNSQTAKYAKEASLKIYPFVSRNVANTSSYSNDNKKDYFANALSSKSQAVRWPKMPIRVFIPDTIYKSVIKSAFQVWQNGSNGIVSFEYVDNIQNAQIEVHMKSKLENTNTQNGYIAGLSKPYFKGTNLVKVELSLLSINPNTQQPQSKEKIYATALHEIGHALGIKGHSQNPNDVMYSSGAGCKKTLSPRDYNTLKLLYSVDSNQLKTYSESIYKTKLQEAIAYVNKYPNKAIGWLNLADLYRNNNNIDKAIEMYKKALTIDSSQNEAYFFLGECYYKKNNIPLSLNYYKKAMLKAPNNKYYLHTFVSVCVKTGNTETAKLYYNNFLHSHPNMKNDSIMLEIQKLVNQN